MSELGCWWSPYRITFTFTQITWLLRYILELREGIYPPNPDGRSSYTDPRIRVKSSEYKAYTETISTVAGTIERRLLKTGMDGGMAYLHFTVELSYEEIAKIFGIRSKDVYTRVCKAIKFCTGRWDKDGRYPFYSHIGQSNAKTDKGMRM